MKGDNPLQAGLRLQQAWWRQECLVISEAGHAKPQQPGGKSKARRNPVVSTMLPESVEGFASNLMTDEAVASYVAAKETLKGSPGIINEDRLRRDLMAAQPLCFNLFGYLAQSEPDALLAWVQGYAPEATSIVGIRLEHAPSAAELGEQPLDGAAFDAFVEYALPDGRLGFIGVETRYADDLAKGLDLPPAGSTARTKYVDATEVGGWVEDAADDLLEHRRNMQFWVNQLLAQRTQRLVRNDDGAQRYAEHTVVVVATRQDISAQAVVDKVAGLLADDARTTLRFCPLDEVVDKVVGHEPWKHSMWQRYTDFTPIQRELEVGSPLKQP